MFKAMLLINTYTYFSKDNIIRSNPVRIVQREIKLGITHNMLFFILSNSLKIIQISDNIILLSKIMVVVYG